MRARAPRRQRRRGRRLARFARRFTDCSFVDNVGGTCESEAGAAGAIYSNSSSPQIVGCEFRGNRGSGRGAAGAVSVEGIGGTRIIDSLFVENQGGTGAGGAPGALFFDETNHGPSIVRGCVFERNVGGGGRKGGPGAIRSSDAGVIEDCSFIENRGGDSTRGNAGPGALQCSNNSFITVDSCSFLGNEGGAGSHDTQSNPGSAHSGAGAVACSANQPVLRNCVLVGNRGGTSADFLGGAGGVERFSGDLVLVNCTIVDNVPGAGAGDLKPAGLRLVGGDMARVLNCIFANADGADEISGAGFFRNNLVRGGHPGPGTLDLDPRFVDAANGDYRIGCASPCRDAGIDDPDLAALDFEGDPRVVGAAVDIGADEYALPAAGSSYCVSTPNSTGSSALVDAAGCNALRDGVLPLRAAPVPDTFGSFFYGTQQLQAPFGNGTRCVGGVVYRLPFVPATGGQLVDELDYASPPQPGGQITAGSTWYFQCYYRDPAAGGSQVDLTNGLQVTFVP